MKKYLYAVSALLLVFMITNPASAAMSDEEFSSLCESGSSAEVQAAIESGADVDARGNNGQTPLMGAAANNNNADVIETLIKNGADVNARDNVGWTPLSVSAYNENPKVRKILIRYGAK
jgi:ankyrin repeat protein